MTLDEVPHRLEVQPTVRSALLMGSAASGEFGPGTDYDLFLIFTDADAGGFHAEVSFIDGHVLLASETLGAVDDWPGGGEPAHAPPA